MRSSLSDKVVLAAQKFVMEEMSDKFVRQASAATTTPLQSFLS
jgi:hypothetical protein